MAEIKTCTSCSQDLPVSKFKYRSNGGRQAGQRHSMCNRCLYVKYTRPNSEKKLQEVREYQLKMGCSDCGFNSHPAALEFDHLPQFEKLFNIGEKVGSYTMEAIWAEIAKCEVVCANCHAIRTDTRRSKVEIEVIGEWLPEVQTTSQQVKTGNR